VILLLIYLVVGYGTKHVTVHDVKYFLDHNLLVFPVSTVLASNPVWFAFLDDHFVSALSVIFYYLGPIEVSVAFILRPSSN
jgi:hypothetical protein